MARERGRSLLSSVAPGALAVLLAIAGCNNATLPDAPEVPASAAGSGKQRLFSVTIEGNSDSVELGKKLTLRLNGEDDRGQAMNVPSAQWKSDSPQVASVASDGTVTGKALGRVTITATTDDPPRQATYMVNVVAAGSVPGTRPSPGPGGLPSSQPWPSQPPVLPSVPEIPDWQSEQPAPAGVLLRLNPAAPRLLVGASLRMLAYQGRNGFLAPAAAVWRSSDPQIATIDEAGVVTGRKAGTVTLSASSVAYPGLRQQVTLVVSAPVPASSVRGVTIKPSRITNMKVGETFWLLAEVPTWNGQLDPNVRWEVGNPALATISETGQLTALAPGKTTVTAIAASYDRSTLSASIPVEILNASSSR